jgi:exodeoxyribonuclease V
MGATTMSAVTARKPVAAPSLNADQSAAVALLMDSIDRGDPIARLLGYAGTGKSFTVVRLLQRYAALRPVILSAPTNKAVSVLRSMAAELGGKAEASTIHRILGLRPEIDEQRGRLVLKRFREPQIDQGALIVVDECSMVDSALMRFIQQAAHDARAQVLYVGDPGQLPPIFEAQSPAFTGNGVTARLTQIVRQKADHPILGMTQQIRDALDGGPVPRFETRHSGDGSLLHLDAIEFQTALIAVMKSKRYRADPDYARVLCWTNSKTESYNDLIRRALLGKAADKQCLLPNENVVACSPILDLKVSIGDMVTVVGAEPDSHLGIPCVKATIAANGKQGDVYVVRPQGRELYKEKVTALVKSANALQSAYNDARNGNRLDKYPELDDKRRKAAWREFFTFKDEAFADLRPIHATTVHRSQGSTYEKVFVDLSDIGRNTRRDVLLRLLYVALTRSRGDVIVTGELPDRLYKETDDE